MTAAATVGWLLTDAPGDLTELVDGMARQLLADGIPIDRLNMSLLAMHPEVASRIVVWTARGTTVQTPPRAVLTQPRFLTSPIAALSKGGGAIRRHLTGPEAQLDFPVCHDLAGEGFTDYVALPLVYTDGRRGVLTTATRHVQGFEDGHLKLLQAILPVLALRIEVANAYYATRSLLETYLGRNAATRVLAGEFGRGTGTTMRAAVWTCDLRGFTSLSDQRPPLEVTRILDGYFEVVVSAIERQQGEVLKFIGDAVLAVFPADDDQRDACGRALTAAREALVALRVWNEQHAADPLKIGIGLHVGDVFYGNIGGSARLDFTVIGAAVNEVCRLEPLCKRFAVDVVVSARFKEHVDDPNMRDLGEHELRGVASPQRVYGWSPG